MDPVTLGLIVGGSSMVGDLLNQLSEKNNAKKIRQQTIDAYKKLLIPYSETKQRADRAGDTVYTKAMNELNSGAFQYAGALNSDVLSALAVSKMVEARQMVSIQTEQQDTAYNRDIMSKVAAAESIPVPEINIGKTLLTGLEEGVGGYLAGKQLGMTEDLNRNMMEYYNLLKSTYGGVKNSIDNSAQKPLTSDIDTSILLNKRKKRYGAINDYDLDNYGLTRFSKLF